MSYKTKTSKFTCFTVIFIAFVYITYTLSSGLNTAYSKEALMMGSPPIKPKLLEIKVKDMSLEKRSKYYELLRSVDSLAGEAESLCLEMKGRVCL